MRRVNDSPGMKLGPLNGDPAACKRAHRIAKAQVEAFLRSSVGPGTRVYIRRVQVSRG